MSVRIVFHYGGKFVKDPVHKYVGGSEEIVETVGLDYLSLLSIHEYYSTLCPVSNLNIYYFVPGYEIWEGGALLMQNDKDVIDMIDFLVNAESEEVHMYGQEMKGPIQVVRPEEVENDNIRYICGLTTDNMNQSENEKDFGLQSETTDNINQSGTTDKGKQKETDKGQHKKTDKGKGKQTGKPKKQTKHTKENSKKQADNDNGEETEHPLWMDEDLEGPRDDDIFEEGPKKQMNQR